ncbi:uncharacterized protein LOC105604613 [Ovis aries]|uniref:uncharacterized protein LOC105604613 n=1 Tax=Ovis aries TaxID=9940 RepID=UPI0029527987|nr:uncharacterized protein LOC105604613 [Ovis aries]
MWGRRSFPLWALDPGRTVNLESGPGGLTVIENLHLNRGSEGASQASETVSVTLVMLPEAVCRGFGRLTLVLIELHPSPGLENRQRGFCWGPWGVSWGAEGELLQQLLLAPGCPRPAAWLNISQGPRAGRPLCPDGCLVAQDEAHRPGTGQGRGRALHWSVLRRRNSSQRTREDPARLSWDVDGSADSPRKSPPQLLPVPLAPRPFLLPGGLTAQEGIKGPEEGAQARDSQHQDGTTGLHRPGKALPPPCLGPRGQGRPLSEMGWPVLFSPGALDSPARSHAAVADPRPPVEPHLLETFGPGGGTYFSTSRDFQTISPGFESLRVILAVLEGETLLLLE